MRYESSVTSLSWIPSEAVQGSTRLPFDVGMAHYDAPPPDAIEDLGVLRDAFQAVALPDIRVKPEYGDGWVRFVQTAGGRTGMPAPRRVRRAPFVQWQAPTVWTTLSLTLHAGGRAEFGMTGASRVPRHWVYDGYGHLSIQ